MIGIADTGFLVAFLNSRDRYHSWAIQIAQSVEEPLITCEAVLAEAAFHTGSTVQVLALLNTGLVGVDFDFDAARPRLETLARRYADRNPDLADLCLICLSEKYPSHRVITVDGDFRIYRRHQREVVPVLMPP